MKSQTVMNTLAAAIVLEIAAEPGSSAAEMEPKAR
jgi:hypothetical protein